MDSIDVYFYVFFLSFFFFSYLVYFIFQAENSYTLIIEAKSFFGIKIVRCLQITYEKIARYFVIHILVMTGIHILCLQIWPLWLQYLFE